jgi:hypothetical protein
MGNERVPGPICSTRVGDDWIDDGTLCSSRSTPPAPAGAANPAKAAFDRDHAYSLAPEARRKRAIDLEIIGNDYAKSGDVRLDNESYLKRLIEIGSGGKRKVQGKTPALQFFIVRGGGEGFLPDAFRGIDANNNVTHWQGTNGKLGETDFDENDILAVFDESGGLVAAARLSRPTYVATRISRGTTTRVYDAWDVKKVFIYANKTPGWIPYLGLAVDDGFRDGSANNGQRVAIDLHKQEQTNGCIFVIDPATPALGADALRTFEPALIKKIMAKKKLDDAKLAKGRVTLGTMTVVAISLPPPPPPARKRHPASGAVRAR